MSSVIFEQKLENLQTLMANKAAINQELVKALDELIPIVINSCVQNKNCNAFNKFFAVLRDGDMSYSMKFMRNFVEYAYSPSGLNMSEETIWYISGLGRISCNPSLLASWAENNDINSKPTLSGWLARQKEVKVKVKVREPKKEYYTALTKVAKVIEAYRLDKTDDNAQIMLKNIKQLLNN